jgi:hypothetical protein
MCLVACLAVGLGHLSGVRLMAFHAFRNNSVHGVTIRAGKIRMIALVFPKLLDLLGVTGEAGVGHIVAEGYLERSVGVPVTIQATLQFEMGFTGVALTALRNVVLGLWTVRSVAIEAGDCIVGSPCGCNVRGWRGMALYAIIRAQGRFCGCLRKRHRRKTKN